MTVPVRIVGLGPAGLDRVSDAIRAILLDETTVVVGRTEHHPASAELAELRPVVWCDDLYESEATFEAVYRAIAARVMDAAVSGPVVYAVPGSASVGERAVGLIRAACETTRTQCEIVAGESFIDLALAAAGIDPFDRGVQIIDAHRLPEPLLLQVPTLVVQFDGPEAFTRLHERLTRLLESETPIVVMRDLGTGRQVIESVELEDLRPHHTGLRVTLALDVEPRGWPGLVATNSRLRIECPWDREQTHHSLARHLLEEAYETLDAIEALPVDAPRGTPDMAGYDHLHEELGDLLLQVVFHATLASEVDAFDVEEVAESIRRKLVRRHPHVFGDVHVETAADVVGNWETNKRTEKGRDSVLDGVPNTLPALTRSQELQVRAASVGFDWPDLGGVVAKVREEIDEVLAAGDTDAVASEVGDLLFSVVNLARRLAIDPELALRGAARRFEERFRLVEAEGMDRVSLAEMDRRWEAAKRILGA